MTTTPPPQSRRSFLTTLAGLALAPVIAARALAAPEEPSLPLDLVYDTGAADRLRAAGLDDYGHPRSILVPSNRYLVEDRDSIAREGYHPGHNVYHGYAGQWDGTLKLEAGCTNPAYVLADLIHREGHYFDGGSTRWQALYDWGVYCDELVGFDTGIVSHAILPDGNERVFTRVDLRPRHTIDTLYIAEGNLRRSLETHFEVWKATDERYRKSWPGIPYPGDSRVPVGAEIMPEDWP